MKNKILVTVMIMSLALNLVGCTRSEESYRSEISELEQEIKELKNERATLKEEVSDIKVENGTAKYVVTFNIKQVHYNLSIENHIKDSMNDISIQIPVDKEYYDSVEIGQIIDDSFRVGSFVMKGSFGSWRVTVEDKEVM